MAQLKDLIVTGASRFIGDVIANQIQITTLKAPTEAGGSSYGAGSNGQVLLSNGSSIYWGSAAPTVTESTVSGWGFTKNTGTVTSITVNTSSPLSGGSATAATTTGSWTIGFSNQNANTVLAGPTSGNAAAPSFRTLVANDLDTQIPVSHFTNDVGYITSADVPEGASAYTGTISAVGTTASAGTNNGFARGDHQHDISKATIDNRLGTGSGTTKFYREDGTWQVPAYTTNTDENVKSTAVTAATTNYIVGSTTATTTTGGLSKHASAVLYTTADSGTSGYTQLRLGNATATSSAGGKEGQIRLYGTNATYYVDLKAGAIASSNKTITLPNATGTVALAADPTIAADSGTATVTLAHNTTYKLTAGGGSLIFKTPADNNTDTKVTQNAAITTNSNFPLLLSKSANTAAETDTVNKQESLTYNPNLKVLSIIGSSYETHFSSNQISSYIKDVVDGEQGTLNLLTSDQNNSGHYRTKLQFAQYDSVYSTLELNSAYATLEIDGHDTDPGSYICAYTDKAKIGLQDNSGSSIEIGSTLKINDGTNNNNGLGTSGQALLTDGTKAYWGTISTGGGGSVTQITAGAGLTTTTNGTTDGGNITGSGTLNLTACSTAATKGPTANVTGTNNTTIKVPKITIDKYGRVTALTEYTYTSKDTTYTLSGLGGIGTVNASGTAPLTLSATKNGTAVSITGSVADASTSASGIVNTTTQHFAGNKGFNRISLYGIKDDVTFSQYSGYIKYYNAAETLVGEQWYDSGNTTNITTGQYYWREYSPNSTANTSTTGYYENYYLPAVDSGLSANKNYQILTTKNYPDSRYVQKSGDTMTGQLYINNTNDIDDAIAPGTAAPLVIGDKTGGHLEFDSNEILAKSDGTTMTKLWLQDGSGPVHIAGVDTDNLVSLYTDGKIQANNNISVKDTNNIGISAYLNVSSAGNQGLYSSGYGSSSSNYTSSAKWIIRRNDAGDTYLGSGKVYVTDGNLYCSKSSATDTYIEATNSTGCRVEIDVSSNGQHGLWSSGYHNGTNYVASSLWLVTRSTDGNGYFNGISQSSKYLYITNSNEIRFDIKSKMSTANSLAIGWKWSDGTSDAKITGYSFYNGGTGLATITGSKVYGAVYNDYAEYREVKEIIKPGRCVIETGNGDLVLSTKRLERGCEIISDTYGFGIGETDKCKTPIAVTGRVLAYLLEDREYAKSHIGWPVCSGPNGTVSIMTEEEEEKYPSRIIGTISEIPNYEEWGSDSVKINGRIWIRVR